MAQPQKLFEFLKAYHELRNPVTVNSSSYQHSLDVAKLPDIPEVWSAFRAGVGESEEILRITRPTQEACPQPPEELIEWLLPGWEQLDRLETQHLDFILRKDDETSSEEESEWQEHFADDENRVHAFGAWQSQRNLWRQQELPRRAGRRIYAQLFSIHAELQREGEALELILGDGILTWGLAGRPSIEHPVFLQRVVIELDETSTTFTVSLDDSGSRVYSEIFVDAPLSNRKGLGALVDEINAAHPLPHDTATTETIYTRLCSVIHEEAQYCKNAEEAARANPSIHMAPLLFLRRRSLGYREFVDRILEDVASDPEKQLPGFLQTIAGLYQTVSGEATPADSWNTSGLDKDVLLTLPANSEQLSIVKRLEHNDAVLVQGPPGTGKTHTIANLIGHFLSEGKKVLVTSHTDKALSVLKQKVFQDDELSLRKLCVSLLRDKTDRNEMEQAISEIAQQGASFDARQSARVIRSLECDREALVEKAESKQALLRKLRAGEYMDLVYDGQTIRPVDAAKFIAAGNAALDYIPPGTTDFTVGLPLSMDEVEFLYTSNASFSPEEELFLAQETSALEQAPTPEAFDVMCREHGSLHSVLAERQDFSYFSAADSVDVLEGAISKVVTYTTKLGALDAVQRAIADRSEEDPSLRTLWQALADEMVETMNGHGAVNRIRYEHDYYIPRERVATDTLIVLDEMLATQKERPLGLMAGVLHPKWKQVAEAIRSSGRPLANRNDIANVRTLVEHGINVKRLLAKTELLYSDIGVTEEVPAEAPIAYWHDLHGRLVDALRLSSDMYDPLAVDLARLDEALASKVASLRRDASSLVMFLEGEILPALQDDLRLHRLVQIKTTLKSLMDSLSRVGGYFGPWLAMVQAIKQMQPEAYHSAYLSLTETSAKRDVYLRRVQLLGRLSAVAPGWVQSIKTRDGIHGGAMPDRIADAWKWRQLSNQLKQLDDMDINSLQRDIKDTNEKLLVNAQQLATSKAWHSLLSTITKEQHQAIQGWRQTIKQIGRGTGKRAPILMRKAQELMPKCQAAIPVWIMSIARVVENFDPRNNKFDVVIIDEASQADMMALSVLYLGAKVVIVGDDEQVSPDSVGIEVDRVDALVQQHLAEFPNNHLFNPRTSIYDIALQSSFSPIMLTEHFRCLPDIIQFSNALSYHGRIRPLRDASGVTVSPAMVEYRVADGYRGRDKANTAEARHVAALIRAMCDHEEYTDKTIGVIAMVGKEQIRELDTLLQQHLSATEYTRRRIQCGVPAQFQGDERDIMIISMVDSPKDSGPLTLQREDGNNDQNRKRYNVAASRAKDQLWVVHSLNPEVDLKPDDIRLRLINHVRGATEGSTVLEAKAESDFERRVIKHLVDKGYKVTPQWKVGAYRIDMVVESNGQRVALECDGERWHGLDKLDDDIKRQSILERLGWRFIRIRGSAYYRDPVESMDYVYSKLDEYDIRPDFRVSGNTAGDTADGNPQHSELLASVKRKANEHLVEWGYGKAEAVASNDVPTESTPPPKSKKKPAQKPQSPPPSTRPEPITPSPRPPAPVAIATPSPTPAPAAAPGQTRKPLPQPTIDLTKKTDYTAQGPIEPARANTNTQDRVKETSPAPSEKQTKKPPPPPRFVFPE